ncbi:hypothetical protein KR093_009327 [Drosophila rubida]|uniref:Uncharacterized protein n=1 Tax=Drosophila rubida TaxID=30044 RepID=A0AAD4JWS3_9MUSC|nr:hypothetical protein KR093_009327 [Drosophila rubida]
MRTYCLVVTELNQMPTLIIEDAQRWSRLIANGAKQLAIYADNLSLICNEKNELYCGNSTTMRRTRKRLSSLLHRLQKPISNLQHILEALRIIQERTEHMWRRVRMWNDDSNLRHYCITRQLSTSNLHELLLFLHKRYEYEWEVKEMVVLGLNGKNIDYDLKLLLAAWCSNRHAGGDEYNAKLKELYWCMGQRQCPDFRNEL